MMMSTGFGAIRVECLKGVGAPHLAAVKQLGAANSATLALFPMGAFDDYAASGRILVAVNAEEVCAGYALYSILRDRVRLYHLCIDPRFRSQGVARQLIDALVARTAHTRGIMLKCRQDYSVHKMWPKLGFEPVDIKAGNNKAGLPVVIWWRNHPGPDLFNSSYTPAAEPKVPAVIDASVFFDLTSDEEASSTGLNADWLFGSTTLLITPELRHEIVRCKDVAKAKSSMSRAARFAVVEASDEAFKETSARLRPIFGSIDTDQDESDLRHVAWAMAGQAKYFISRDERLLSRRELIEQSFGLRLLSPADFIVAFDALLRTEEYEPVSLSGSDLSIARVGAGREDELLGLFQQSHTESRTDFINLLREQLAVPQTCQVLAVERSGQPLALFATRTSPNPAVMLVPIFRVQKGAAGAALAHHIARRLTMYTVDQGRRLVLLTETGLSSEVQQALEVGGFVPLEPAWRRYAYRMSETRTRSAPS